MFNFLSAKKNIFQFDTFYLTYDEPGKDERWDQIKQLIPNIKRVDKIKGFDRAHKECANQASTSRVVIIDGDNSLENNSFRSLKISKELLKKNYVFSYSSKNSINGLIYGNGGIKCWPRELLLKMNSHENALSQDSSVDFCFTIPYYQVPLCPTISNINITPEQAFRAGFREGVKMSLDRGHTLDESKRDNIEQAIFPGNLFRLKTWCEIGRDVEYGIWAIYGARLGLLEILRNSEILELIRDYDWFETKWKSVSSEQPAESAIEIAKALKTEFNFQVNEYDETSSKEFKMNIKNPHREGLMFPEMQE